MFSLLQLAFSARGDLFQIKPLAQIELKALILIKAGKFNIPVWSRSRASLQIWFALSRALLLDGKGVKRSAPLEHPHHRSSQENTQEKEEQTLPDSQGILSAALKKQSGDVITLSLSASVIHQSLSPLKGRLNPLMALQQALQKGPL